PLRHQCERASQLNANSLMRTLPDVSNWRHYRLGVFDAAGGGRQWHFAFAGLPVDQRPGPFCPAALLGHLLPQAAGISA
ncbi:MAG TPA: hypothetical protein VFG14_20155, partial [Chthoniobacteraceae bacterium]|nr:hypothetical protein [Chthoniobacteraceae bacterium]